VGAWPQKSGRSQALEKRKKPWPVWLWSIGWFVWVFFVLFNIYWHVRHKALPESVDTFWSAALFFGSVALLAMPSVVTYFRVYDIRDRDGRVFAFEVDNTFFARVELAAVISGIPGVQVTKKPRRLSSEDRFCEWRLGNIMFAAEEPFGDNNRFWIGPIAPTGWVPEIEIVRAAFLRASGRDPIS